MDTVLSGMIVVPDSAIAAAITPVARTGQFERAQSGFGAVCEIFEDIDAPAHGIEAGGKLVEAQVDAVDLALECTQCAGVECEAGEIAEGVGRHQAERTLLGGEAGRTRNPRSANTSEPKPRLRRALALEESRSVRRLLSDIEPEVALLQAVAFDDSLHLFLITGATFVHQEVEVSRTQLFNWIFEARKTIDQAKTTSFTDRAARNEELREPLGQLHEWLIAPIKDELDAAGTTTLMLNLRGQIRYLPFAALWDGEQYLAQRYELAIYTPAANTRYDAPGLEGKYWLNDNFTKASFEDGFLAPPSVLHIATHFQIRPGDEASSYLVLGDGKQVSIAEMKCSFRYDFDGVELLTLSACETALGGDGSGMELEGFGALAQNKGANSVVATLWQVSDEATPELMQAFYRALVDKGTTKSGALKAAQSQMIASSEYSDPVYWAPFVLMGNWR